MAFCTKCGKELAEGEVCSCSVTTDQNATVTAVTENVQQPAAAQTQPEQSATQVQQPIQPVIQPPVVQPMPSGPNFFALLWEQVLSFVKAPITHTNRVFNEKDPKFGLIFAGLNAVVSLLLTWVLLGSATTFGALMCGFFLSIVLYAASCGLIAMFGAITKVKVNFLGILGAMGLATIPLTALGVVNIILTLISSSIGMTIILMSFVMWVIATYMVGKNGIAMAGKEAISVIYAASIGLASAIVVSIFGNLIVRSLLSVIFGSFSSLF